jgi:hypothetical protein
MAQLITNSTPIRQLIIDEVNASLIYIGKAMLGATTDSAEWQIFKIEVTTNGTSGEKVTTFQYADGDDSFNNIWDDRKSLTYSG